MDVIRQLALGAFVLLAALNGSAAAQVVADVSRQNEAVNAAIAKAKSTLPAFFARHASPQPGDSGFRVKIRFATGRSDGSGEHIWAGTISREGDTVTATIDNVPRAIPNLAKGQRVTVPVSQLTDWMFRRDDKMHGAYTVRALLPFMPRDEAEAMRNQLAPE